jgi:hypothetical protein
MADKMPRMNLDTREKEIFWKIVKESEGGRVSLLKGKN